MKKMIFAWLCISLVLPAYAGAVGLTVSNPRTDANGVVTYDAASAYNGPGATTLRVLSPTSPAQVSRRFIYVLPVAPDAQAQDLFGDGLEELRALNVHNLYNAHLIAPSFHAVPWYANHDSNPDRRYESFLVNDLVPWVQANLGVTGQEEHWLVGLSKSGFGAVTLLFRNPTVFNAAAAWDFPAEQPDTNEFDMLDNYGTETNFQSNYRLTDAWIAARKVPFQTATRLWLSYDNVTFDGVPTFLEEVDVFAGRLQAQGVQFMRTGGAARSHSWISGWLPEAVASLQEMRYTDRDDFNRANGSLGPNWTADPQWGDGASIADQQVASPLSNGGAFFWNARAFAVNQFSQIRISGAIGDWAGVSVRGKVAPAQGYWVAIREDGATLYAFVNGVFHVLVHDATGWSTGDTLRLEVRTVATNTARLTVFRNGTALFTHDDASHFIANGQPGIGLFATTAISLDDWRGGEASGTPSVVVPGGSSAQDDFNRPDGALGPNWRTDPVFGSGAAVAGNQVASPPSGGGAFFWSANNFGADQYSQIRITGAIGDFTGVSVRGRAAPSQGYWLAVKGDGAYLYAFVNGVFHQLVHNVTGWATGDTLRLEVQTVAPNTARLTVYRNGSPLFTHDDASHFIENGQPGIGLFAGAATSLDDWRGGGVTVARDDFNRANGALGPKWAADPLWGDGASVVGNQVVSPLSNGGALLWGAQAFAADQYSQIRITGAIGDWVGVSVRGKIVPEQGYWLAVKDDGASLYSFVNGAFHLLVQDATIWATGDTLRLEVRTVASNTARLMVYRNGVLLFTHDDASHFIASGQPGIGLYATTAIALDDWEGGTLPTTP
jgi:hypothetical protein